MLASQIRHSLLCGILVFGFDFINLLLTLFIHFLLKILLFPLDEKT